MPAAAPHHALGVRALSTRSLGAGSVPREPLFARRAHIPVEMPIADAAIFCFSYVVWPGAGQARALRFLRQRGPARGRPSPYGSCVNVARRGTGPRPTVLVLIQQDEIIAMDNLIVIAVAEDFINILRLLAGKLRRLG